MSVCVLFRVRARLLRYAEFDLLCRDLKVAEQSGEEFPGTPRTSASAVNQFYEDWFRRADRSRDKALEFGEFVKARTYLLSPVK